MMDMGRPKSTFTDLPRRMTGRKVGEKVYFYYQARGKKIPLGSNLEPALRKWADLEAGSIGSEFHRVADAYEVHIRPNLAPESFGHYRTALKNLSVAFKAFRLEQIEPRHVKDYIRKRSKKGAALFEKRILSALFNWAREQGLTSSPNPATGVKFSKSERNAIGPLGKRDRYVTDAEFAEVYERAGQTLRDAMDLALLTGQRPSDILKMTRPDIRDGALWVRQQKTGNKVGIRIEGELKRVLERILARPRAIQTMYLVADDRGQRVTYGALSKAFASARGSADWQFRDIRAKAATDSPDLASAKGLLGHANETTTTIYRRSKGTPVSPLK